NLPAGYLDLMDEKRPPVIFVCNEKGGVGKTTITTNLAAHFAKKRGMRVLVIDLDKQGSMSNMFLSSKGDTKVSSNLDRLLRKNSNAADFRQAKINMSPSLPTVDLISANKSLSPTENKVLLEYVIQEAGEDVRYLLAKLLICSKIRNDYDV